MAYTKEINKNTEDSHQSSPAYVLTFIRWGNRDTKNYKKEDFLNVRKPFTVVNDAISVSVQYTKSSPSPSFSCTLMAGDINYLTAVQPGDFVIVNMVNWESQAMEIRQRALNSQPINRYEDGFKGLFKIMDVRSVLNTNPNGDKTYRYDITGNSFDEFNSLLYFNPALIESLASEAHPLAFLKSFGQAWSDLLQDPKSSNVQVILQNLIKLSIGPGGKIGGDLSSKIPLSRADRYMMPPQLGALLNRKGNLLYASDINNYYFGIWKPKTSSGGTPKDGFNSVFKDSKNNFFETGIPLQGSRQLAAQDFQSVQVWSLLQNYSNPVINEMYLTPRLAKDGFVYPSLIARQKPFNTRHYVNDPYRTSHTQYLDLPRWRVSPDLILSYNIGRNESGRINFVMVFTRDLSIDPNFNQALQLSYGGWVLDGKDVSRSGMKPYIVNANYDYPSAEQKPRIGEWSHLVADWLLEGHLKLNGVIQCAGIVDPIAVGDNLELDGIVFHIEGISHKIDISGDGKKTFRTNISLSMGVDERSSKTTPVYAEMDHTDSYTRRVEDSKYEKMLPGFSDSQDTPGRVNGEEVKETTQTSFTNPNSKDKGNKRKR